MAKIISVETVLFGATFYAVSYVAAASEKCLIIERKSIVGSDFAACLNAAECTTAEYSPMTCSFRAKLIKSGILLENGNIHIVPVSLMLSEFILEHHLSILLETEIVYVQKKGDHFCIRIFSRDGFQTIIARKIIDTDAFAAEGAYRTLGLMLVNGTKPLVIPEQIGFVQKERFADEWIFHLRLSQDDNTVSAREKMRDIIERTDILGDWQAGGVGACFAWHYPNGSVREWTENGVLRIASASFGNLLSAMEGGFQDAAANNC